MSNVSGEGPPPPHSEPRAPRPTPPEPTPPEPTPPEPAVGSAGPDVARLRRRRPTAKDQDKPKSKLPSVAATTAVTAVITAVIGGVLSQDRIDSVFSDDDPSDTSSAEVELDYKPATDSTKAVAADVPSSWGVIDDGFRGIDGITSPGLALRAGPDPSAFRIESNETAYVGASAQAVDDLGLTGLDDTSVKRLLEARRESVAFLPQAGCVPTNDHTPELGGEWVGAVQVWQDCSSFDGWRAIEVEMVSSDRDVYVFIQIGLPASTPDEVSQRILDSVAVLPARLPVEEPPPGA